MKLTDEELDHLSISMERTEELLTSNYFPIYAYYKGNLMVKRSKDLKWKIVDDS